MPSILSVNNYYYLRGGAEFVFLEQNKMLENYGWQIVPFCMKNENNIPSQWSNYFVNDLEYGANYTVLDKVKRAGKVIYSNEAKSKLRKVLSTTDIDVCHAHNIYHHISPSILSVVSKKNIPIILTLHDLKIACPAYKMLNNKDEICEKCKGGKLYNVILNRCIKNNLALSSLVYLESRINRMIGSYNYVDKFIVPSTFET